MSDEQQLRLGDCLSVMAGMTAASVDAVVTDPPYGLGFMGKAWDALPPGLPWAQECLRLLKPGGYLLAFGGTRTWHRLAVAVEDAGFEIRDSIAWLYGSGFPKSHDVSKAIDKAAGAERVDLGPGQWAHVKAGGTWNGAIYGDEPSHGNGPRNTAPATPDAKQWAGWGTALKPAFEPIVVARKPLVGTVVANVLAHGTGALNIDACRVRRGDNDRTEYGRDRALPHANTTASLGQFAEVTPYAPHEEGRWPANVVLDESQAAALDEQSGASRFFYVAKAPAKERPRVDGIAHPTVKPLALMRWLVRLVTPPGGIVLDPFLGSGTTGEAAELEGFDWIGIEREATYLELARRRLAKPSSPVLDFASVSRVTPEGTK